MQARVEVYHATHKVGDNPDEFQSSTACAESWCRWVVCDSMAYAARHVPQNVNPRDPQCMQPLPQLPVVSLPLGQHNEEEDPFGFGGSID